MEGNEMVKLYVKNIINGKITFDKVPAVYKAKVEEALREKFDKGEITQQQLNNYLGIPENTGE